MMTNKVLYYHHVGQEGAALDFTRTIFTKINISDIKKFISPKQPHFNNNIYRYFEEDCSDSKVNCWGVPKGANYKIQNLKRGDLVLLIESLNHPSMILCEVIAYMHIEFKSLSNFLWETNRYPFIFFLDHKFINKSWLEFCRIIGYSEDYNPRGLFLNVDQDIVFENGGIANLVSKLEN
jgi:5-methylcytosine-specific restriction protein A